MNTIRHHGFLIFLSLLVGLFYIGPVIVIQRHLAASGQPFIFTSEGYRNDLTYLARAREIYDGHFPPGDLFSAPGRPTLLNPLPSLILAAFMYGAGGNIFWAYVALLFTFSQVNFLLFYAVGRLMFSSRLWMVFFSLVAVLTPIALKILNFDTGF